MKFGSREVCDVVFRAKSKMTLGSRTFYKDDPVLIFDTLKTSNFEGAANTVYATGGRGASRLLAWDGEKTLTFTMEDALISPEGLAILAGADLVEASSTAPLYKHKTLIVEITATDIQSNSVTITNDELIGICEYGDADPGKRYSFFIPLNEAGEAVEEPKVAKSVGKAGSAANSIKFTFTSLAATDKGTYMIDFYAQQLSSFSEVQIRPDFVTGNSFYIEGETLYRRESDGRDLPATIIIPNGKVQSNFTMNMANSGDPSTYSFKVDALAGYTYNDSTKKVLAVIQIDDVDASDDAAKTRYNVTGE